MVCHTFSDEVAIGRATATGHLKLGIASSQWVIASTYEFAPKSTNLLVFAPDGSLVLHASGRELDEKTLDEVVTSLRSLLDEIQESEP